MPTPERLKNIALYYLSRYAASEASLRRVLNNRVRRACLAHPDFAADREKQAAARDAIEQIIAAHVKTGAVNDAAVAAMKVANLRRGGKSMRFILRKLSARGLAQELVARALADYDGAADGVDAEMKAALAHAKKRHLGRFRIRGEREGDRQKDFASLARTGFSVNIIRKILALSSDEIPEVWE